MGKYKWKQKFFTIYAGQAVSLITSAILQMAIIFYITEKTGSAMVLSIASLIGFLPYAVLGPTIGVLVDRYNRKAIMIIADLIIAIVGAVLAFIALYIEIPIWMIMVVLFIRSVGTAFHSPALSAVTPLIVPESQLTKCAGYSQSLQSISYIISPAAAAFLYSIWELNMIIGIDIFGAIVAEKNIVCLSSLSSFITTAISSLNPMSNISSASSSTINFIWSNFMFFLFIWSITLPGVPITI